MTEAQILRALAVAGLALALLVSAFIFFNSGVTGGTTGSLPAVQQLDSAAAPGQTPPAATTASTGASSTPAETGTAPAASEAGTETAASTTPATTSTTPSGNTYTVKSGDSFYTIARKYNTSIAQIQALNPDLDPSNLSTGTTVNVP